MWASCALLGLWVLGVRCGSQSVVRVASRLRDRTFFVTVVVVDLGFVWVHRNDDCLKRRSWFALVALSYKRLLVTPLDVEDLTLDRNDREAASGNRVSEDVVSFYFSR